MLENSTAFRVPWSFLVLAAALQLAACSGNDEAGTAPAPCSGDLASIRASVFAPSCATAGCHDAQAAGGLDLSGDVLAVLVGVPAVGCPDAVRVVPGAPAESLLYQKVSGTHACGAPMPIGGSLSREQVECIAQWIRDLDPDAVACETCGGEACVDLAASPAHCGACGASCPEGVACEGGACACPGGAALCEGSCTDVRTNASHCGACGAACPAGSGCAEGTCLCGGGLAFCGGACVDTDLDAAHCGACDAPCPAGAVCASGACSCPAGQQACGATCVDTSSDPANCGTCGSACEAGKVCAAGACATGCGALVQCGGSCVDVQTSASHCGGCDEACPAGASCVAGACACPTGTSACDGACINTSTDPSNCGACGKICSGGQTCSGGACVCPTGSTLCGSSCVDTSSDPSNCSACGKTCAAGQSCTSGKCSCATASVSFAADVQPIFTASCGGGNCHTGASPSEGLDLSAGKSYASLVGVAAAQCKDGRKRVVPGDPAASYLVDKLLGVDLCAGSRMPKSGQLPQAQIDAISAWICGGAPNN